MSYSGDIEIPVHGPTLTDKSRHILASIEFHSKEILMARDYLGGFITGAPILIVPEADGQLQGGTVYGMPVVEGKTDHVLFAVDFGEAGWPRVRGL